MATLRLVSSCPKRCHQWSKPVSTEKSFRAALLPLPGELSFGYHRIALFDQDKRIAEAALIVVPSRCYQPEAIARGGRVWGGALQLYGVRSERNWGIGDFTDLRLYIDQWAARGASLIGMNPLHALFLHNPAHVSPYSPSSRLFLNVLYLMSRPLKSFARQARHANWRTQ
jgi:(1->4)-alpha-D-glucan 1-alpha-D-glucosylmutase